MKVLTLSFIALFVIALGCGRSEKQEAAKNQNEALLSNSAILFTNLDYRDTVNVGDSLHVEYKFINDGYKNLIIKGVTNGGTCKIGWTQGEIQPVMEGKVEINCVFSYPGMIKQGFMVSHNSPQPDVALTLRVLVRDKEGQQPPGNSSGTKKMTIQ